MSSIQGTVAAGIRWIIDQTGAIVGYRNPITDQDADASFGGGAGGASGLAFASDPTAVGASGATYTVNGVTHTMAYNGDSSVATYTVDLTTTDLVRTVSYVDGFPIFSGAIEIAGAVVMTLPMLKELRDEILAPAGLAARGFRARIRGTNDTDALAYSINAAGTKRYMDAVVEWDGAQLIAISNCRRETIQEATYVNTAGTSGALRNIVFPGWLMGISNTLGIESDVSFTAGTSGVNQGLITFNSTTSGASNTTASATQGYLAWRLKQKSTTSQTLHSGAFSAQGGYGFGTGALVNTSINTGTTDVSVDFQLQTLTATDKTATLHRCLVQLLQQ